MQTKSPNLAVSEAFLRQQTPSNPTDAAKRSWMEALAGHYKWMRRAHPDKQLLLAMDIDGTIIDMRNHIAHALRVYDRQHDTQWFKSLRIEEVGFHESRLHEYLLTRPIPRAEAATIEEFVTGYWWGEDAIFAAHQPFSGALEVARWFQLQPDTDVVFVTGRPERIRERTLASLKRLGDTHRLRITGSQLKMKRDDEDVPEAKIRGLSELSDSGGMPFAFIDNEPENLAAVYISRKFDDTLLLHADTIFLSSKSLLPESSLSGRDYELLGLAGLGHVPARIQFVWHGVSTARTLAKFLESPIKWAELEVKRTPETGHLAVGSAISPQSSNEADGSAPWGWLDLRETLMAIKVTGRAARLAIKEAGILKETLAACRDSGLGDEDLWFSANLADLSPDEFKYLRACYPASTIQTPIDNFASQLMADASMAERVFNHLTLTGINRMSVGAAHPRLSRLITVVQEAGWEVSVDDVRGLEGFLRAVLLTPDSITSDFDFES